MHKWSCLFCEMKLWRDPENNSRKVVNGRFELERDGQTAYLELSRRYLSPNYRNLPMSFSLVTNGMKARGSQCLLAHVSRIRRISHRLVCRLTKESQST